MTTLPLAVSPTLDASRTRDTVVVQVWGCIVAALALTAITMTAAHLVFDAIGLST